MVKKNIGERICRDCGEIIIGRRSDAQKCLECRRKAEREASQRIKKREKEGRILKKAERTGVKGEIEREKTEQILQNLKEEFEKEEHPQGIIDHFSNLFSKPLETLDYLQLMEREDLLKEMELKPFKELIKERVEMQKEKEEEKENKVGHNFHTFS